MPVSCARMSASVSCLSLFACAGALAADDSRPRSSSVEEVVVTAQKVQQRLQDVPIPVTAVDTDALTTTSQLQLQDYYTRVPGLSLVLSGNGSTPVIAIRGITTGGDTNPTVGTVIDEVSYGASVNTGQSTPAIADVDPGDLARVEVLRGPQGTLYGASSIGGLLKFVTVDPSTEAMSGNLQLGSTTVSHSDDYGYNVRGSVNVPLSDSFALRASGFTSREPGYIDNVATGQDDVNRRDSDGGRLSALWRPSDSFSLKLSALIQDTERGGTADVDTALGSDPQQSFLRDSGLYERKVQAYSATIDAKLGNVQLVSATGYSVDKSDDSVDFTTAFGGFFADVAQDLYGVDHELTIQHSKVEKLTQELRATLPLTDKLDWLIGVFYTEEDTRRTNQNTAADDSGQPVGLIFGTWYGPAEFKESALFSTFTYSLTERFDVQFGGRYSDYEQKYDRLIEGPLLGGVFADDTQQASDDAVTYLLTPRFKVTPDFMIYGRFASGYRPGGPNIGCGLDPRLPCSYEADTTQNYDIGVKGALLEGKLSIDAAVYYIDWKDIQIPNIQLTPSLFYTGNASKARSQGIEFALDARPLDGLSLSLWAAYNDAELRTDFPSGQLSGQSGDRLPYSSRTSGSFAVDQDFTLSGGATLFLGGTVSYVGDRKGNFQSTPERETFPSYVQTDLRTGLRYESWIVNVFCNNLTDERGVLRGGLDAIVFPSYFSYIQPRTIGVSFSKSF